MKYIIAILTITGYVMGLIGSIMIVPFLEEMPIKLIYLGALFFLTACIIERGFD